MSSNGILGDLTLGQNEAKRITTALEEMIDEGDISTLAGKIMDGGFGLVARVEYLLKEMEILEKILYEYYVYARQLRALVKEEQKLYLEFKKNPYTLMVEVNEKWDRLRKLYDDCIAEYDRVDNSPEVKEIRSKMRTNYEEYEELLLQLGTIIAPLGFNDDQPTES